MTAADRKSCFGRVLAVTACSTAALLLSACESSGGLRFASVGSSPGAGSGGSGSGGGTSGTGSNTGGTGSGGSTGSGSGTGSGTGGSGTGSGTGSGSGSTTTLGQLSPAITTAGNAVLAVSDAQGNVTTPIATALPVTQPVTGTITRVLDDTGTVLVDAGQGRNLLLQGMQGVVGDVLSIDVGGQTLTTGLDGTSGAVGVGVLGGTQPTGTLATVGVLNAGNTALATVNGIADVRVTNITSPTGGIADNLLNVALGGNQLIGSGDPALINANVLPGGTALPTSGITSGVLAPVTSTVSSVTGIAPVVDSVTSTALTPVSLSADASAGTTAQTGADATVSPTGALSPVTGTITNTVSGTLNTVGSALNLTP